MRTTKFSSIAIAMLMTSLCFFLTATTTINAASVIDYSVFKTKGDPRTVIMFRSNIVVIQEEPEQLEVKVVRKSDGATVYQTTSSASQITISTEGWESGEYTVQTNCPEDDYQEFPIEL